MALSDGLVHLWELEEDGTDTRVDSIGGVDLTNVGGSPSVVAGRNNLSNDFDGTSDYIYQSATNLSCNGQNEATIAFWVNSDDVGNTEQKTLFFRDAAQTPIFQVRLDASIARAVCNWRDTTTTTRTVVGTEILVNGAWFHIVCRYRRNDALYMNINYDAFAGTGTVGNFATYNPSIPNLVTVILGANPSGFGSKLDGRLDQVAIWNTFKTDLELATMYNGGNGRDLLSSSAYLSSTRRRRR